MGRFDSIKKSRKKSKDIDEKIEYLNKELRKTGLDEMMKTTNVYQGTEKIPNTDFSDFEAIVINGYGLGLSGADGNGAGDAYVGTIEAGMRGAGSRVGQTGVAISPPHPISGRRQVAFTLTGFAGLMDPLRPGQRQGNSNRVRGSALWFFNPHYPAFAGQPAGLWHNFEWHTTANFGMGAWGFYDTSFFTGSTFLNTNLDDYELNGVNLGTQIKNQIASINVGSTGNVGTPKTIVFTQNRLDDPSFIPIDIGKLSPQGYNYLKGKSRRKKEEEEKTYSVRSSMRPVTTTTSSQTQQTPPSSQTQQTPSPSSDFDLDVELTPDNIPDEFKADDSEKPSAQGVTLTKWMSRTDFMKNYPDSSMEEYLSALPYGATNFMKPDPNFPGARIVDTDAYERYFLTGDTSGVSGKPKHSTATPEPEQKKWGGKTKEQIIADLEADSAKYSAEERAAKAEMQKIALDLGMDFVSLIGGLFTGGTTATPVLGKLGVQLSKKYGKSVAGKMLKKLLKKFRNKKNNNQIDDVINTIEKGANDPADEILDALRDANRGRTKLPTDAADNFMDFINSDLMGRNITKAIKAGKKNIVIPYKGKKVPISIDKLQQFRFKGPNYQQLYQSHKQKGELLTEAAKLGHFEPEVLNVDIEKLRKGILPEFPKDPPPEMINGYSAKSKLAPKTIEGEPFLNITKKDLAKNHRFTDKEISEYMDEINAINDYIRKNPAELKYAMIRYPKDDPRLAQLNFKMDQMKAASDEYMETHFPENKSLFNKLQQKISNTIGQTDPKNFKDHTPPPQFTDDFDTIKRRKETVSRHFKKRRRKKG